MTSKVNGFDVLKIMAERNQDIKSFDAGNITQVSCGKNGWGRLTIAIDNATAQRILNDTLSGKAETVKIILLAYDVTEYQKLSTELSAESDASHD